MKQAVLLLIALVPVLLTALHRFEAGFDRAAVAADIGYNVKLWAPAGPVERKKRETLEEEIEAVESNLSDLYNREGPRCRALCKKKPKGR